jgi:CubicO group peptidase (beta-lactamase class C family)
VAQGRVHLDEPLHAAWPAALRSPVANASIARLLSYDARPGDRVLWRRRCSSNGDGESFGLGWWLAPTRGIGGTQAGQSGYGMSGFVDNRIWLEPDYSYGVVILSNRVHPVRSERAPFTAWCARLLEMVAGALQPRPA